MLEYVISHNKCIKTDLLGKKKVKMELDTQIKDLKKCNKICTALIAVIAVLCVALVSVVLAGKAKQERRAEFFRQVAEYGTKYLYENTSIQQDGNTVVVTTQQEDYTKAGFAMYGAKGNEMIAASEKTKGEKLQHMADDCKTGFTVVYKFLDGINPDTVIFSTSGGEVTQEWPY